MQFKKFPQRTIRHFISAPFIYLMTVPLLFLDFCMEVYHRICFPLYGIEYVDRDQFIQIDRQKLSYLSWAEKFNCAYCGYANGLMAYGVEIAGRTEDYWCGIKHQSNDTFLQPQHHEVFIEYGDQEAYEQISRN